MPRTADSPAATAHELRVVVGRLIRRLRAEGTLPMPQASVLGRLERDGPATTSGLAAAEGVRPQSMAQTVAELERAGHVERRPDPADGRRILLELTERGRATVQAERRSREGWLAEAIARQLDDDDRATLRRAVEILRRLT